MSKKTASKPIPVAVAADNTLGTSAITQILNLSDEISMESDAAIALSAMVAYVLERSGEPGVDVALAFDVDDVAPGLSVVAGIIRDKVQVVKERTEQLSVIARHATGGAR
jgi:hypothetical protein